MRPGLLEADFIRTEIPEAARPNVERAIVAPLTLLYPDSSHKPVIPLTLSQYRNQKVKTLAGDKVALDTFYDADLVDRLKSLSALPDDGRGQYRRHAEYVVLSLLRRAVDGHQPRPGDLLLSPQPRRTPPSTTWTSSRAWGLTSPSRG